MANGKGLIRAGNRSAVSSGKAARPPRTAGRLAQPTVCESCGAVLAGRAWRRRAVTAALLDRAAWAQCPECEVSHAKYCGRVVVSGGFARANQAPIRKRIDNTAAHQSRQLVSVEKTGDQLEVLTTSQQLAHRIVRELKKAFRGRTTYHWSDDGSLFARWERD